MRFPHLAHRSAAAHKLHSTTATTRYEFDSGEGETFSRQPALAYSPRKLSKQPEPSHYLDEAFPENPLMPAAPLARAKVRLFTKLIEELAHNSCTILTFATAYCPGLLKFSAEEREAGFSKSPSKNRSAYKRDAVP